MLVRNSLRGCVRPSVRPSVRPAGVFFYRPKMSLKGLLQQLGGQGPVGGQRPYGEQLMVVYTNLFIPKDIFFKWPFIIVL